MPKQPRHRPFRDFPNAERKIIECDFNECIHCGVRLVLDQSWHIRKTIQSLKGPIFVAGKSKSCLNPECRYFQKRFYASGVLKYSLPHSTYGIDVLAFIGWEHEQKHRQLKEIHQDLNKAGVLINERNVGVVSPNPRNFPLSICKPLQASFETKLVLAVKNGSEPIG